MSYVANKQNMAQLTNVHYWDSAGNAWSGNLIGAGLPFALLPNPVLAADLVIFGIDSTVLNSGPFCSLVFDLMTAITGVTATRWRYSDASGALPAGWAPQIMQDNTNQDGLGTGVTFDTLGIRSAAWEPNPLWIVQNPTIGGVALGVTGLWICAEMFTVPGAATPPIQQNRDIYTITWPTADIAQPGGDMETLLRVRSRGEGGATLTADNPNRWLAGLRKTSRGIDFRSFINFSDGQNPLGVTVTLDAGAWANDVIMPTGRKITHTPIVGWLTTAYVSFSQADASQYRGIYHLFVRAMQPLGVAGTIRLRAVQYLGGHVYGQQTWASKEIAMTWVGTPHIEPVDLGQIHIPGVGAPNPFSFALHFQASGDGATAVELIDFILLPVDEWAADLFAPHLLWYRGNSLLGMYADIDGIRYPKELPHALGYPHSTESLTTNPRFIGGRGGLIPNETQVLHSFTMNPGGATYRSYPWSAQSIDVWQVQRYSSMRGAR